MNSENFLQIQVQIGSQGRITLPKRARELYSYVEGTVLRMKVSKDKIELVKV